MNITNISTLLLDIPLDLERVEFIIIQFQIRGIHYHLEIHENYSLLLGILAGSLIQIIIIVVRFVFKNLKRIFKNLNTRSRRIKKIRGGDRQFSINKCFDPEEVYQIINGELSATIRRILDSPLSCPLIIACELAIFGCIVKIFGPTFRLGLSGFEISIPYRAKTLAKFVISAVLVPIITKSLINFSPTFSLPILAVIALSNSLLLGPINFEKFITPVPYPNTLNVSEIRYIDIPEVKKLILMQDLSNKDKSTIPDGMIYNQCSTEKLVQKASFVRNSLFFANPEKEVPHFYSKKISFKPLSQRTKTLADLKREDESNVHDEAQSQINNYKQNQQKLKKIKIKDTDSNYPVYNFSQKY